MDAMEKRYRLKIPDADIRFDGMVGEVELVGCVQRHPSKWFRGPLGFVLANARRQPFKAMPGKLKLFALPREMLAGA